MHDLSLADELLLLGLDDAKGKLSPATGIQEGLAGAILVDLAEGGWLEIGDDGELVAGTGGDDPADELLAEALAAIRSEQRTRDAKHWVGKLPRALKPLTDRIAQRHVARGILSEERGTFLGIKLGKRYPEVDAGPEHALRERLTAVLTRGEQPTPHDAQLIALLAPYDLVKTLVPREQRKVAKRRAEEIADHGPIGSAVAKRVEEAVVAAVLVTTTVVIASS